MCGIIGYSGEREAAGALLDGLKTLEYRGYDSAGIAVVGDGGALPRVFKKSGKLETLSAALGGALPEGRSGIGHTRWATHGRPTDANAHPHTDCGGEVAVVHNGIVENYRELRRELAARGHVFRSETDSECVPHMIEDEMRAGFGLAEATRRAARRARGANAIVAVSSREPGTVVGARTGNAGGIVAARGNGGAMLSSDVPALLPHTREVFYLAAGEMVSMRGGDVSFRAIDGDGGAVAKRAVRVERDARAAEKGGHRHYMHKEIHEQPAALASALAGRLSADGLSASLPDLALSDELIASASRAVLIGMGTSMHAAMVGRRWMESLARLPAEFDNSSEFRYRDPVLDESALAVTISQSGETVDTLTAMEMAAARGARQITLCNFLGPQSTNLADHTLLLRAGQEVAVAASKTFICSLGCLLLLALELGARRGTLPKSRMSEVASELARVPEKLASMLADESRYEEIARKYARRRDFLFLGRGYGFPLAMEGALKLKEVSYIHAEGYPAGEMKHGPISLIDEDMPAVAVAPDDSLVEKMRSNISEARARGAEVIAIVSEGDDETASLADDAIEIPRASEMINPFLTAIPMQMLAYRIGVRRGCDVDQPRNLAKTVTVE